MSVSRALCLFPSLPLSRSRRVGALFALSAAVLVASFADPSISSAAPAPAVCSERSEGGDLVAYGLTADQRLICFKIGRPSVSRTLFSTAALTAPDSALVGIDARPANGGIYGLGNGGGVYLLDLVEARPVLKSRLSTALDGRFFGIDFNPTVDRLRVVSDTGQNLRINVDTGATTVDAFLRNGSARALGVAAVAYTNNDTDASTGTTLYDLDSVADQLVIQAPPNDGVLGTVGAVGFRGSAEATFDIASRVVDGKAVENMGYAALDGGGALFEIDLKTGAAKFLANLGANRLTGLAFPTA